MCKKPRGLTNRAWRARLGEDSGLPEIPAEDRYMIVAFRDCGVCKPGFSGAEPLGWTEVLAYADGTGTLERGPDVAILWQMCRAYVMAHDEARADSLAVAPVERGNDV